MSEANTRTIRVLALCGSLRKASYNRATLRVAQEEVPDGMMIEVFDELAAIPHYDDDLRAQGWPPAVEALVKDIAAADAMLFVTPEYNFSIPGVLKNAIDWFSRHPDKPFAGKAVGIMGASQGPLGTGRGQYHLRQMCVYLDMFPVNKPEVFIGMAQNKFDAEGRLTDEVTRGFIRQHLVALRDWARRIRA